MNCIYCGNPAGFIKLNHKECENQLRKLLYRRGEILKTYISGRSNKIDAQKALLEIAQHPFVQKSYLNVSDKIRANEIIMRNDYPVYVTEYKNHCSMVRTGLSYARYPVYEEGEFGLGLCAIIISDKMINIIPNTKGIKRVSIAINKIIAIQTNNGKVNVEVKTTSPVPHRISFEYKEGDLDSVYGLIKCFSKL